MKILGIVGSPRKKYSYEILKLFENEFRSLSGIEFDCISLYDFNIEFCRGCSRCKVDKTCPINDDAKRIMEHLISSDILIFVSPVYENNVTAVMKNIFDRFHHLCFWPFDGKYSINIAVSAFGGTKFVLDYVSFNTTLWGMKNIGKLALLTSSYAVNDQYKKMIENKIKRIVEDIQKNKSSRKIDLNELIVFKDQKNRIISSKSRYPQAYEFWKNKGWLKMDYYYDIKIDPIKKVLSKILNFKLSDN
jgi:multimeric flavodoxin WrbA